MRNTIYSGNTEQWCIKGNVEQESHLKIALS